MLLAGFFSVLPAFSEPRGEASGESVYKDASGSELRLVCLNSVLRPGEDALLGVLFDIASGRHIYWRNDGGAGLPTEIKWELPDGLEGGEAWSFPVLSEGEQPYLEYVGRALVVCRAHIPENYGRSEFPVRAEISWLECGNSCIPGQAVLSKNFPVGRKGESASPESGASEAADLTDLLKKLPRINLSPAEMSESVKAWREDNCVKVWLAPRFCRKIVPKNGGPEALLKLKFGRSASEAETDISVNDDLRNSQFSFYAYEGEAFQLKLPPDLLYLQDGSALLTMPLKEAGEYPERLRGELARIWPQGISAEDGWEIDVPIAGQRPAGLIAGTPGSGIGSAPSIREGGCVYDPIKKSVPCPEPESVFAWGEWLWALALAFLGGVLLNLMPCVFPVLSLKVMSFISHGAAEGEDAAARLRESRKQAWGYLAGVVCSFALLAAIILVLRSLGETLGWGFQMQSPAFVACMILLFWLLVLNLAGVFEVGVSLTGTAGDLQAKSSGRGLWASAGSGAAAVLAATPCSAPFMGSALGYTLQAPAWAAFAVFISLGLGMALPYVWLASSPSLLKRLPRPGRWMETLRQFLAFPLAAACSYFFWVYLELRNDSEDALTLLLALVTASLAAWIYGRFLAVGGKKWLWTLFALICASALYLMSMACGWGLSSGRAGEVGKTEVPAAVKAAGESAYEFMPAINADKDEDGFYIWSEAGVREALKAGYPVFIDFGAAWCLTCQVNEQGVLDSDKAEELFKKHRVCLFKADWTAKNPVITKALQGYGRSGVPLYVCLMPDNPDKPIILPEILTYDDLEEAFEPSQTE